jgi:syntaxin-binding protein 1
MASMIDIQRELILNSIKQTTRGDWKILIVDEDSQKLINNVVKEDDILNLNITSMRR